MIRTEPSHVLPWAKRAEFRLMVAVLEQAFHDLQQPVRSAQHRAWRESAATWVRGEDSSTYPWFTFEQICGLVRCDPDRLRQAMLGSAGMLEKRRKIRDDVHRNHAALIMVGT